MDDQSELIPDPQVAHRYGVTLMSLWRWDHKPELEFPPAVYICRRKYRERRKLEAWERKRAAASGPATLAGPPAQAQLNNRIARAVRR
jgi:hypothetical protein